MRPLVASGKIAPGVQAESCKGPRTVQPVVFVCTPKLVGALVVAVVAVVLVVVKVMGRLEQPLRRSRQILAASMKIRFNGCVPPSRCAKKGVFPIQCTPEIHLFGDAIALLARGGPCNCYCNVCSIVSSKCCSSRGLPRPGILRWTNSLVGGKYALTITTDGMWSPWSAWSRS